MPKLKTKRAAKKRYRVTGGGRVKVGRKGKRHMLTGKSRKRQRNLLGTKLLTGADAQNAVRMLPYA
jgi:large subunit ribosomal protein L35